jgi:hypothetical protein
MLHPSLPFLPKVYPSHRRSLLTGTIANHVSRFGSLRPNAIHQAERYRVIPSFDPALWRRASWTVLTLALVAFVCLGLAEQGSRGGGLLAPPDSPLPFERHRIFGLDLSRLSSLQAQEWLNAAGNPTLALIVVRIDADVVQALASDEGREAALTAVDGLRQTAGGSPLGFCLERPPDVVGGLAVAQAAVGAIESRFPEQVVYVRSCHGDAAAGWQEDLDQAARPDAPVRVTGDALIPLGSDTPIQIEQLDDSRQLSAEQFRLRAGGSYTIFELGVAEPVSAEMVEDAAEAMADTSHSALVFVAPSDAVDPAALVASIGSVVLAGDTLPEGYSAVTAPQIRANDQWQRANVGTVTYLRSTAPTAAIGAEFVGTDVYLIGIESPESGIVQIWLDPASQSSPPTVVLNLESFQAMDAAIPIASGLPAARHESVLQAVNEEGQSVTISGLFVTGKPATAWTGTMAAGIVLLAGVIALAERSYSAVTAIRRRSTPPPRRPRQGHPRVFARDR